VVFSSSLVQDVGSGGVGDMTTRVDVQKTIVFLTFSSIYRKSLLQIKKTINLCLIDKLSQYLFGKSFSGNNDKYL
jgi:hypothetical protein